jgi:hypothetical protein
MGKTADPRETRKVVSNFISCLAAVFASVRMIEIQPRRDGRQLKPVLRSTRSPVKEAPKTGNGYEGTSAAGGIHPSAPRRQ